MFGKNKKRYIEDMTEDEIKGYLESKDVNTPFAQTESDRVDESVGAQEAESGTEDSQSAKARVDESEGMESDNGTEASPEIPEESIDESTAVTESTTESPEQAAETESSTEQAAEQDVMSALGARITALEERLSAALERLGETADDESDENKDFGQRPSPPNESLDGGDDERIMNSYYRNPRSYK